MCKIISETIIKFESNDEKNFDQYCAIGIYPPSADSMVVMDY